MLISNEFSSLYNEGVAIYVQSPARRLVKINLDGEKHYKGNFFLSFPYVFFSIRYSCIKNNYSALYLKVGFGSNNKIKNLFLPPLPNIDDCDLRVCIPLPKKKFSSIDEMCKSIVARFWVTEFNDSMAESYFQYEERGLFLADFDKWQAKTKKNPKWFPNGRSLIKWEEFNDIYDRFLGKKLTNLDDY